MGRDGGCYEVVHSMSLQPRFVPKFGKETIQNTPPRRDVLLEDISYHYNIINKEIDHFFLKKISPY